MPTNNLRRFSNVDVLWNLNEADLRVLLSRYAAYFEKRQTSIAGPLDLERLAAIFLAPEEDVPEPLVNALYLIHEMSSPAECEELVDVVRRDPALRGAVDLAGELTPHDLALKVYLVAPTVLEREHAERFVETRKAFEYYCPARAPSPGLPELGCVVEGLEKDLSAWFASKLKGDYVHVHTYAKRDDMVFVVRHGDTLRRERARDRDGSVRAFYRPERCDVLVYHRATGELRVNAATRGEREAYRTTLGHHLFASADHFRRTQAKYTLKPLLEGNGAALACGDIDAVGLLPCR